MQAVRAKAAALNDQHIEDIEKPECNITQKRKEAAGLLSTFL